MTLIEKIAKKYSAVKSSLGERGRRLWAGGEADSLGRGGVAWVARATGLAISTVRKGRDEFRAGSTPDLVRERRPGAGRPRLVQSDPLLQERLEALVSPTTRGDPESPLRWTCKSVRVLAEELRRSGHPISPNTVGQLLREFGYSLQGNAKTKEGKNHPDRDEQFKFISAKSEEFLSRGLPVISVDSKKKELVGEHSNNGREWHPKGKAIEVLSHDFVTPTTQKATPFGVYDIAKNAGFVNVGTNFNTASFAVRSIEKWWERLGSARYPKAKELFITADAGGSNSAKSRLWKLKLQELADRFGMSIHVSHFPPGTSKWNKIEHRLFSFISINWRGHPLTTYETVVRLIAGTRTQKGLSVTAELDSQQYALGVGTSHQAMAALLLERAPFHGEWNYTLRPRSAKQRVAATKVRAVQRKGSHVANREKWLKHFEDQRRSRKPHQEFCAARRLNYSTYMHARLRVLGVSRRREASIESRERWMALFREHKASGLSQAAFARSRGIHPNAFSSRRWTLLSKIHRKPKAAE